MEESCSHGGQGVYGQAEEPSGIRHCLQGHPLHFSDPPLPARLHFLFSSYPNKSPKDESINALCHQLRHNTFIQWPPQSLPSEHWIGDKPPPYKPLGGVFHNSTVTLGEGWFWETKLPWHSCLCIHIEQVGSHTLKMNMEMGSLFIRKCQRICVYVCGCAHVCIRQ